MMRSSKLLWLLVLLVGLAVLLAGCGKGGSEVPTIAPEVIVTPTGAALPATATVTPAEATPMPSPSPGEGGMPLEPAKDIWQNIQERGVMIVGTSADYPPFEYYNQNYEIDGFDMALIKEVARQLGVDVEIVDIAFDGLGDALALGQIDVAIAAISITPEREEVLDFSQVYFVSEDAIVALPNANIPPIHSMEDLAKLRVGVQKGSVFEDWLEDKLVKTGLMPETQLFVYGDVKQAVPDLEAGRVDVLIMDRPVAELVVKEKGMQLVASGLHRELYGIAMAKGQHTLRTKINQALSELLRNHVIDELAKQYLQIDEGEIEPVPTPTPTPAQPQPTPTPPQGCYDGLAYVQDLNYDDHNMTNPPVLQPGEAFRKGWRVRNTGTCTWDSSYVFDYVYGNVDGARMGGQPTPIQGQVAPGQTYDIYVDLVAPLRSGVYQGFWQMHDGTGRAFGERVYVGVRVPEQLTPTPFPTATPSAAVNFWTDNMNLTQGQCTVNHWRTQGVKEVYYYHDGQNWQDHGVAGTGDVQECPPQSMNYYLRVVHTDGSIEQRAIHINVAPAVDAPYITYFLVDPPGQITLGQCVNVAWEVVGNVSNVNIYSNDRLLWQNAPYRASLQDCPASPGQYNYRIEARGPVGMSQANHLTLVVEQPAFTPTPPPPPTQPIIYAFSVEPTHIAAGMCVTIGWQTGGSTTYVQVLRNGQIILDGMPLAGTQQDCYAPRGEDVYELRAIDGTGQMSTATVRVQVD